LSDPCPPDPPKIDFNLWHTKYFKSNSLSLTITLNPKLWPPLSTWELTHRNQLMSLYRYMLKNYPYHNYYIVTETQPHTGNLHWHGIIDVLDTKERTNMLYGFRKTFGRTELTQIRNELHWYNYIHKDQPVGSIISSN